MKRALWIGVGLFGAWLCAPGLTYAQTCEPRVNVPSYESGRAAPIICDPHGSQHVRIVDDDGLDITVLSAATATAAAPSLSEGQRTSFSVDLAGNTRVTLGTCFGGDSHCEGDDPDSYLRVRTHVTSSGQKTADAQIKASAGWVSHMICQGTDAAAVAGTIIVYDNTAESGTALFTFTVSALDYHNPIVFPIMTPAATGIYLGYNGPTDMNCTVFYK